MDKLLEEHPLSNYSHYRDFLRDLIQRGICNHGLTFDTLNYELYRLNKEIQQELIREAFTIAQGPTIIETRDVHTT